MYPRSQPLVVKLAPLIEKKKENVFLTPVKMMEMIVFMTGMSGMIHAQHVKQLAILYFNGGQSE
jgi:hypothetical protein